MFIRIPSDGGTSYVNLSRVNRIEFQTAPVLTVVFHFADGPPLFVENPPESLVFELDTILRNPPALDYYRLADAIEQGVRRSKRP